MHPHSAWNTTGNWGHPVTRQTKQNTRKSQVFELSLPPPSNSPRVSYRSEEYNLLPLKLPAKTRVFVWEQCIETHLTQFMRPQLCTNSTSRQKPEIYILYFRHAVFFHKISGAEFRDICGNIMARKPVWWFWCVLATIWLPKDLYWYRYYQCGLGRFNGVVLAVAGCFSLTVNLTLVDSLAPRISA